MQFRPGGDGCSAFGSSSFNHIFERTIKCRFLLPIQLAEMSPLGFRTFYPGVVNHMGTVRIRRLMVLLPFANEISR